MLKQKVANWKKIHNRQQMSDPQGKKTKLFDTNIATVNQPSQTSKSETPSTLPQFWFYG